MNKTGQGTARAGATRHFWRVARCLALLWVGPALIFNVDWSQGLLTGHNIAAVIMILGSALFIEGAHRLRSAVLAVPLVIGALFLVYVNTKQATRTLSLGGEAASEAKSREIAAGSQVASQRVALGRRVEVQVKLAGWDAVGVHEAALQAVQNSDPRAWGATSQCEDVTAAKSGQFCARVAAARAKVEAAKERDRLQGQLDAMPAATVATEAVGQEGAVTDPYATNIVTILAGFGIKATERAVKAEEALSRALGFELLAALGPTCWLAFIDMLLGVGAAAGQAAARLKNLTGRRKPKLEPAPVAKTAAPANTADDVDRFIADELEVGVADVRMKSGEIRKLWDPWCAAKGIDPKREDELWKRLKSLEGVKHDPNNNRPRYLGVRKRVKLGPQLVVSNP